MQRCAFFAGEGTSEHLEVFIFKEEKKKSRGSWKWCFLVASRSNTALFNAI